jgi:hypothetical protein
MPSPFALSATTLIDMGYSPMPVGVAGPEDWNPSGKEPGRLDANRDGDPEWYRLKGWNAFCKMQARPATVAYWSTWPDAGVCVATGFNNLVAVDIDRDEMIADIVAVLPDAMVGKVGKRGATYLFRSAEPMPSKNYRDGDGRGLIDFLSSGKQTVVPPTHHPDTGRPYEWLTPATLLNTPITSLPVFTDAHRIEMERVLRDHGWRAPEPAQPRREAVARTAAHDDNDGLWHDDSNTVALANLSAWVPELGLPRMRANGVGYRAVAPWRTSSSGRAEAQRSSNLSFHPTGIEDFGSGEKWTPIRVVAKARGIPNPAAVAWLRKRLGLPEERLILANAGTVKPTYPDRAVPLDDATVELRSTLGGFEAEMKTWRAYRNQALIKPPLIHRKPPVWGVKIETGGGKSHQATRKVAEWTKRGWRLAYVTSRIKNSDDVARDLTPLGIKAQIYRGREQDDPSAPDETMCRNLPAARAAIALGLSVHPAVCMRRIDGEMVRCPFAAVCGHEKQREATPDVWVITSASLAYERPDFIGELDGLVIDEKFHDKAIGDPVEIDTTGLWRAKIELCSDEEHDFLSDMRAKLRAVVEDNGNGPLSRTVLDRHQVFAHAALRAATLEQRRVTPDVLRPGLKESGLNLAIHRHAARNKLARDVGELWNEIATFMTFDQPLSGRITVDKTSLRLTPLRTFHPSWLAPMIVLDATLTTSGVLDAAVFGDEITGIPTTVTPKADISIQWPDYVSVRQVLIAPVAMNRLGLGERAKRHPRNERDILRFIRQLAALVAPARLGVISYLGLRDRFVGQVPSNVRWMHFGATSGSNDFETVAGLVVIGRWWISPEKVEATASVLAGYPVKPIGEEYRKRTGGIRMTDGSTVAATVEYHPDPFAEAVRRGVTEDELLQAVGRLRPHRRSGACFLDIVGDVVLPVTVDEVVEWDTIKPGAEADMMAEGVVLTNVADAKKAFGLKDWGARGVGGIVIGGTHKETTDSSAFRTFRYQKAGSGQKEYEGWYLPGILPGGETALRAWLEAKLGPLAVLTVEWVKARDSAATRAMFARIGEMWWGEAKGR